MTAQARERALEIAVRAALCEQAGLERYRQPRRRAGTVAMDRPVPLGQGGGPAGGRRVRFAARVGRLLRAK